MATQIEERARQDRHHTSGPEGPGGDGPKHQSRLRRWFGGRGTGTGLTATGASLALAILVGLGLFAVVSNTVLSSGNSAESGTYAYEGPVELEVALVDPGAPFDACDTATYDSAVLPAILTATADLDAGTFSPIDNDVCVRTAGTFDAYLRVTDQNILDVEVGACEATEASAGLDTTCLDGEDGELSAVVNYFLSDATFACPTVSSQLNGIEVFAEAMIPAGTTCRYSMIPVLWPGAWAETLAAAQTDRVSWDIAFALVDDPFEPNDDLSVATPIDFSLDATINPETDQDWYAYTHTGTTLNAATSGSSCESSLGDTVVSIHDAAGTELATNDDDGASLCSALAEPLPPGDYYVVVQSFDNAGFVPSYRLSVSSS